MQRLQKTIWCDRLFFSERGIISDVHLDIFHGTVSHPQEFIHTVPFSNTERHLTGVWMIEYLFENRMVHAEI